jgi:formate-dependent nitrite reductase membrane component NrfD
VGALAVSGEPERDITPALGRPGEPAFGEKRGEQVQLHVGMWKDGEWSYLYKREDTAYGSAMPDIEAIREAARRARGGEELPEVIQGPIIHPPVWTWEIPLYFWFGGMAAGASFVAFACDVADDEHSAAIARRVALAALIPCPPLLILDLGRPERFYNMLRIIKPRSPMSMGAWALTAFGNLAAAAVGADLLGRRRAAKRLGAANALVGGYLGSYTGVLLAATAVPLWARSRLFLGPIFVATATATGAAACRLTLAASGIKPGHPTRQALGRVEAGAMFVELALSTLNERRLGPLAHGFDRGPAGRQFKTAKWFTRIGLAMRLLFRRRGSQAHHAASGLFLLAALLFRYAWVGAGRANASEDRVVAQMHRTERHGD